MRLVHRPCSLFLLLLLTACASPPEQAEVEAWRAQELAARPVLPAGIDAALAEVEAVRGRGELRPARDLAVALAERHPKEPRVLWRAARGEADLVLALKAAGVDRDQRDLAASSGLLYARAARGAVDPPDADVLGQLAYSLGTTTHLLPMGERSDRAREVLRVAAAALKLDPQHTTALATQAVVHLRLATLPWMARAFGSDIPDADLALARRSAVACVKAAPTLEHRLLLAKVLIELEREAEARRELKAALAAPSGPRAGALRAEARALREELE